MNGEGQEKKPDEHGKNPGASGEPSQWMMIALNQINARLDRIESDIRDLGTSIGNIKKMIWTAAGVIIAVGLIGYISVWIRGSHQQNPLRNHDRESAPSVGGFRPRPVGHSERSTPDR